MNKNFKCAKCKKEVGVNNEIGLDQQPHVLFGVGAECFKEFALELKRQDGKFNAGPFSRDDVFINVVEKMIDDSFPGDKGEYGDPSRIFNHAVTHMGIISALFSGDHRINALNYYKGLACAELNDLGMEDKDKRLYTQKYEEFLEWHLKNEMSEEEKRRVAVEILEDALGLQFFDENLNKAGDYRDDLVNEFRGARTPEYAIAQALVGLDPGDISETILLNGFLNATRVAALGTMPAKETPTMEFKVNPSAEIESMILADFGYELNGDIDTKKSAMRAVIQGQYAPLIRKGDNSLKMFIAAQSHMETVKTLDNEIYKRAAPKFDEVCKAYNSDPSKLDRMSWDTYIYGTKMLSLAVKDKNLKEAFSADSIIPTAFFPILAGAQANKDADSLLLRVTDDKIKVEFRNKKENSVLQEFEKIADEKKRDFKTLAKDEKMFLITITPKGNFHTYSASFEQVAPEMKNIRNLKNLVKVGDSEYTTVVTKTYNGGMSFDEFEIKREGVNGNIVGNMFHSFSPYRKDVTGSPCMFPAPTPEEIKILKRAFLKKNPEPDSMYHLVARKFDELRENATENDAKKASSQ